jgi:hypothetical protein
MSLHNGSKIKAKKPTKRNPLKDPTVGDVITSSDRKVRRTVEKVRAGVVTYHDNTRGKRKCDVASWQHWARQRAAKVVGKIPLF